MSSASHASSGSPSFSGLLTRIFFIVLLWAGLVMGMLHFVGHVLPTAYQISQAEAEEADRNAHEASNTPSPATQAKSVVSPSPVVSTVPAPPAGSAIALASSVAMATASNVPPIDMSVAPAGTAPAKASTAPAGSSATAVMASTTAPAASAPAAGSSAGTPKVSATTASPAASAPAGSSAAMAAPATSAGSAPSPAPAPKAGTAPKKMPYDSRLAGFNRTALTNVAIFYSIVISILCVGAIILQLFKYCHRPEEAEAH